MNDQELVAHSQKLARMYVARRPWARAHTNDLAQEVVMVMLKARESYRKGQQPLEAYAAPLAQFAMRDYLNSLHGPVKTNHMAEPVRGFSLLSQEAPEAETGWRDDRTVEATAHDDASWSQALSRLEPRVQLMVEARMQGATNEEIGAQLGVSREYVRQKLLSAAQTIGGAS